MMRYNSIAPVDKVCCTVISQRLVLVSIVTLPLTIGRRRRKRRRLLAVAADSRYRGCARNSASLRQNYYAVRTISFSSRHALKLEIYPAGRRTWDARGCGRPLTLSHSLAARDIRGIELFSPRPSRRAPYAPCKQRIIQKTGSAPRDGPIKKRERGKIKRRCPDGFRRLG